MPTKDEHVAKASGNEKFALSIVLKDKIHIDWALISMFYAGVHYVEAYLATIGQHIRSHETRDKFVARDTNLRSVYNNYSDLKYFGYNARYEVSNFDAKTVSDAAKHLSAIKTKLKRQLT